MWAQHGKRVNKSNWRETEKERGLLGERYSLLTGERAAHRSVKARPLAAPGI